MKQLCLIEQIGDILFINTLNEGLEDSIMKDNLGKKYRAISSKLKTIHKHGNIRSQEYEELNEEYYRILRTIKNHGWKLDLETGEVY